MSQPLLNMDKLVSLCKRRGFIFPGSELYGGLNGTWDYGPLGVELKRNVQDAWWRSVVMNRTDVVGLDSSILLNSQIWQASGHLQGFTDPMVDCKNCRHRFRADQLESEKCPDCGGEFTEVRQFNLMFKTFVGPVEEDAAVAYLRPETAQGIFVNFENVLTSTRLRIPFGIAQVGKSFRNEINPRNFTYRSREFEQMEMEFFVKPGSDEEWHQYWLNQRLEWYIGLGIKKENLRIREHTTEELSHYAKATYDIEYLFPFGWSELEGIANRTDFDLRQHSEFSGRKIDYFDQENNERYVPYVIEPAAGLTRATLAFLADAYTEESVATASGAEDTRTVLRLHPKLAPIKVAVLPLSRNAKLTPKANEVYELVRAQFPSQYDDSQSIGRRYRRQDEAGTPICVTIDFQTVEEDNAVTIRVRDSMEQERISIPTILSSLNDFFSS
jgi:glycyl-tRNA synthetase